METTAPRPWKLKWNELIQALVLIRLGQELGAETDTARAVAALIEFAAKVTSALHSLVP